MLTAELMFLSYILQLHSNADKGDGSVKYILSGEGAGSIFVIDDSTGDIHATKSLDREQRVHYILHAQALDRKTNKPLEPESEFIIKVQDINDNAPAFLEGPYSASVPEMSEVGKLLIKSIVHYLIAFYHILREPVDSISFFPFNSLRTFSILTK